MPNIAPRSALQVIKNFRTQQLNGLTKHLRLYGPLPTLAEAAVSSNPDGLNNVAEPSIVLPNPFIARKNPKTGKWRCPKYSLRRQADLVKKAKETGNLAIIPPGPKLFAMQLRMRRLQSALSPTDSAIITAAQASLNKSKTKPNLETARAETEKNEIKAEPQGSASESQTRFSALEAQLLHRQDTLAALEQDLEKRRTQHELDELAAFEKSEMGAELQERKKRQAERSSLQTQISVARSEVVKAGQKLYKAQEDHEVSKVEETQEQLWTNPFWVGDAKKKTTKGEELGVKLYAGKKKMFKGHAWEKEKAKRLRRQSILMRDMTARVARYKSVSIIVVFNSYVGITLLIPLPSITRRENPILSNRHVCRNPASYLSSYIIHCSDTALDIRSNFVLRQVTVTRVTLGNLCNDRHWHRHRFAIGHLDRDSQLFVPQVPTS